MEPRRVDADEQASYAHVFRHPAEIPAESEILSAVLGPSSRVLDVGTGATGRTATLVKSFGVASVVSIEINPVAIAEFAASEPGADIHLVTADLARLPFDDAAFDVVLVAFHGMDYILDPGVRRDALRQGARVLRPGGWFIVNAWNRIGILFSPYRLRSIENVKVRARYLVNGDAFRRTLTDPNGLRLHQATIGSTIKEVESHTDLELEYVIDSNARSRNRAVVTITSIEPYFVFRLPS